MENDIKKICTLCGIEKSINQFHKGTGKYDRRSMCNVCTKERYDKPDRLSKISANRTFKRQNDEEYRLRDCALTKENYRKNPISYLIRAAKARAKKTGMEFNITKDNLILPEYCPLLGIKLKVNTDRMAFDSYSLDRIDSKKGYIKGNVWVISFKANCIKNDGTIEEIELLAKNLRKQLNNM